MSAVSNRHRAPTQGARDRNGELKSKEIFKLKKALTVGFAVLALSIGSAAVVAAGTHTASLETGIAGVGQVEQANQSGDQGTANQSGDQGTANQGGDQGTANQGGDQGTANQSGDQGQTGDPNDAPAAAAPKK
jgi:hypothetical protein